IRVEALAFLEAFGLAELIGTELAVRGAVCRNRADHSPAYHRGRLGQTRQTVGGVLCRIAGTPVQILNGLLRAFQGREFLEHPSDFVEKARILLPRWARRFSAGSENPIRDDEPEHEHERAERDP